MSGTESEDVNTSKRKHSTENEEIAEESASKRKNSTENEAIAEESADDEWIGPLPTDAAPAKKVKGLFNKQFQLIFNSFFWFFFQFWNLKNFI